MNSLGLILLLSTLSALSAAFAPDCPLEFTPVLPRNSDFKKACSADPASKSPCFHHVSGSLRSADVISNSPMEDIREPIIVKDGFLTDFTFSDNIEGYYVKYTEAGVGLQYRPVNSGNCFDLSWSVVSERARDYKLSAAVANGGGKLFESSDQGSYTVHVCDRYVDLWLEKR
ncbi:related to Mig1-Mig1 protein, induced during biotrophic phase [Ustilago bromivora]|uniref:Related to Mig1 - Mig1 protein, induced during biotrophic phase n=1 Tax=Ustilago bromivora TaxID=307758 RepID=A0A1K0G5N3_9BASI|nr:related to Mig1-Mig1 protein, induced during biotrophic phase [Ustilago bromivora]SYW79446.1 related to Mig1 - Mig1 protein, induced during biotrophic phase [Ustilago bromivora]